MASPVRSEDWRAQSKVKTGNTDLLPLFQLGRVLVSGQITTVTSAPRRKMVAVW
jgi:hypothetical protein